MKKDLGLVQAVYPMPVLMVAAYDENEKGNVMNVAWGQICDEDKISRPARRLLSPWQMRHIWMWPISSGLLPETR